MTVGLMHVLVAWLKLRVGWFRKAIEGTPIVMRSGNEWHGTALRRSRLHEDDILTAAREKGIMKPEEIEYAIFERSGSICVIPRKT